MLERIRNSRFTREVAILSSGTAIAQAIPIAVSPLLTRLYAPDEFGLASVYLSCVSVFAVIATGCYDQAIVLPASDVEAADIVVLTLKLCAAVSLMLFLPVFLFGETIAAALGNRGLAPWLYLLPVSVMATGSFNVFQYWSNRTSQYRRMAAGKVQIASLTAAPNLAFGLAGFHGGVLLGGVIGQAVAAFLGIRCSLGEDRRVFSLVTRQGQMAMARRYAAHPKHIVPGELAGTLAIQIPVFLVSSAYSMATAGFFSLAWRLVTLPSTLVARAIGDVYRQKVAAAYHEKGEFRGLFKETLKATAMLSIIPFILLYLAAPELFALVFGEAWRTAGGYAQILLVSAFFQFIFTPVDKGALVVGASGYIAGWYSARLFLLGALYLLSHLRHLPIEAVLWIFVAINSALYVVEGVAGFMFSRGGRGVAG